MGFFSIVASGKSVLLTEPSSPAFDMDQDSTTPEITGVELSDRVARGIAHYVGALIGHLDGSTTFHGEKYVGLFSRLSEIDAQRRDTSLSL